MSTRHKFFRLIIDLAILGNVWMKYQVWIWYHWCFHKIKINQNWAELRKAESPRVVELADFSAFLKTGSVLIDFRWNQRTQLEKVSCKPVVEINNKFGKEIHNLMKEWDWTKEKNEKMLSNFKIGLVRHTAFNCQRILSIC